jgi:hypothetical protein
MAIVIVNCETCSNHHPDHYKCDKCQSHFAHPDIDTWKKGKKKRNRDFKFCPICGAKAA